MTKQMKVIAVIEKFGRIVCTEGFAKHFKGDIEKYVVGEPKSAGWDNVQWVGKDTEGNEVASNIMTMDEYTYGAPFTFE